MKKTKSRSKKSTAALPQKNKTRPAKTSTSHVPLAKRMPSSKLSIEIDDLRMRLNEAEETLSAIRKGEVDALVVAGPQGEQVYALKGAEQPYRILVESMNEGALTLTAEGFIINCNKAFSKIAGRPCGMLTGMSFKDLVSKKDRKRFEAFWLHGCESEAKAEVDLQIGGRIVPAFVSLSAHMHDREVWVFMVVTDISERKRAEAKLEDYRLHLERMVGEKTEELTMRSSQLEFMNTELEAFAYAVSHDLKAPLRHIKTFVTALGAECSNSLDEKGRDYVRRVQVGTERMNNLIDALLQLSRITRGELRQSKAYLSTMAKTAADELAKTQLARSAEFIIADNVTANGDQNMLRAVIDNLIGNAWKFTEKRPDARIEFGVKQIEGKDIYFVKDNGAGFDMKYSEKLFMPFQRLHTENEFSGLGIGLSIVQRIIQRHGGRIWAEGEVDKGATFYFTLN